MVAASNRVDVVADTRLVHGCVSSTGGWLRGCIGIVVARSPLRECAGRRGARQGRFAALRARNKFRPLTRTPSTREGRSYADPAPRCELHQGIPAARVVRGAGWVLWLGFAISAELFGRQVQVCFRLVGCVRGRSVWWCAGTTRRFGGALSAWSAYRRTGHGRPATPPPRRAPPGRRVHYPDPATTSCPSVRRGDLWVWRDFSATATASTTDSTAHLCTPRNHVSSGIRVTPVSPL